MQETTMNRRVLALMAFLFSGAAGGLGAAPDVSLTNEGWSLSADPSRETLTISHDRLGALLTGVRLHLQGQDSLRPLKGWVLEKRGPNQLSIKTESPRTGWLFEPAGNGLKISSTELGAVLTAQAPASPDRIVARLLDPQGVPVEWVGTDEVKNSFGGSETRNPSYLPSRNPECMYFALGQVAAANLHALFDRRTDTAIDFSDRARLDRNAQDANALDVRLAVPGSVWLRIIPDYFTKTLGLPAYVPFDDSIFPKAPAVWCSWTAYYAEVKEEDIVRNTDWLAEHLRPYGFEYVQIDDGYDRGPKGEHYWIENWSRETFPHGPAWLANYIKSKGLRPGLWLVPNAYAGAVEQHPDWYLRDKQGRFILDYRTPSLDSTHPGVLAFLKKLFKTLGDWGFEYYKFDGEHALPKYVPGVDRDRLYDKTIDPLLAYRNRIQLIREAVGPNTFIEGCPAGTPLNALGVYNSTFAGHDVYNSWQGMYALFSSINANAFLNHIVVYLMPGEGIDVGTPMTVEEAKQKRVPSFVATARTREDPMMGFGTTLAEARTLVTYVALTGVVYPLASVMPELPEERVRLLKATLPTLPILPVDLYSRGTDMRWDRFKHTQPDFYIHNYPEILDLKVNAKPGVYDVVGVTNWRGETATREISFADQLGLRSETPYVVFDFWQQKPLGVFRDRLKLQVEPHDTRVLLVHPLMDRPQLIGLSRHISGTYSLLDLAWDEGRQSLRGSVQPVPGEDYTLWIHVPAGLAAKQPLASARGVGNVPLQSEWTGSSLKLNFKGRQEPVEWQVTFSANAGN
jgi:hypothetical protein